MSDLSKTPRIDKGGRPFRSMRVPREADIDGMRYIGRNWSSYIEEPTT